jgi:hypothetical protein
MKKSSRDRSFTDLGHGSGVPETLTRELLVVAGHVLGHSAVLDLNANFERYPAHHPTKSVQLT